MAGAGLLALVDDIATILDDVATMTKVAAKKTAGVLGDDLALNAQQVAGVRAARELPVVWAVALGSLKNKLILIPAALVISALAPWMVTVLLMLGGAFLCYEGFEKLAHKRISSAARDKVDRNDLAEALADPDMSMVAFEKDKIGGAIRTDFILSAEIIVITLGIVTSASFGTQVAVLLGIGLIMTVGVYGLVAGIVKLDDLGLHFSKKSGEGLSDKVQRLLGAYVLRGAPYLMKGLSTAGMVAMFMVGGSILIHGLPGAQELVNSLEQWVEVISGVGRGLEIVTPLLVDTIFGLFVGAVVLAAVNIAGRVWSGIKTSPM